jgi:hypothetical protein
MSLSSEDFTIGTPAPPVGRKVVKLSTPPPPPEPPNKGGRPPRRSPKQTLNDLAGRLSRMVEAQVGVVQADITALDKQRSPEIVPTAASIGQRIELTNSIASMLKTITQVQRQRELSGDEDEEGGKAAPGGADIVASLMGRR